MATGIFGQDTLAEMSSFFGEDSYFAAPGAGLGKKMFQAEKQFQVNIVNSATATRTVILFPGIEWVSKGSAVTGAMTDGAFNDKNSSAGLVGTGTPRNLNLWLSYLNHKPTWCLGFKIKCNDAAQIEKAFTYLVQSPYDKTDKAVSIYPTNYKDDNQYQEKIAIVDRPFLIGNEVQLEWDIVGKSGSTNSDTTITFYLSIEANMTKGLRDEVLKAQIR